MYLGSGSGKGEDKADDLVNPVRRDNDQKTNKGIGKNFLASSNFFGVGTGGKEFEAADNKIDEKDNASDKKSVGEDKTDNPADIGTKTNTDKPWFAVANSTCNVGVGIAWNIGEEHFGLEAGDV